MKCNSGIIIVEPKQKDSNAFDKDPFENYSGKVLYKADDVKFVDIDDDIIFFTIKPKIEEENWFVISEEEVLINLTKE